METERVPVDEKRGLRVSIAAYLALRPETIGCHMGIWNRLHPDATPEGRRREACGFLDDRGVLQPRSGRRSG